jgi:hypothetical protein
MRIDFTLTLPGLFEIERIERLSATYGVQVLAKVIFSFSPDIVMSPLALPRSILEPWIDEILPVVENNPLKDILIQLKTRPTFQEQYGEEEYAKGIARGKARVLQLEKIRGDTFTMGHILSERTDVYEWWNSIS